MAATGMAVALLPIIQLKLLQQIVDELTIAVQGAGAVGSALVAIVLWMVVQIVHKIILAGRNILRADTLSRCADRLCSDIYRSAATIELSEIEQPRAQEAVCRALREVPARPINIIFSMIDVLCQLVALAGIWVVLSALHPMVLLVAIFYGFLDVPLLMRRMNRSIALNGQLSDLERRASYFGSLMLSGESAKERLLNNLTGVFAQRFDGVKTQVRSRNLSFLVSAGREKLVYDCGAVLLIGGIVGITASRGDSAFASPGAVVLTIQGLAQLQSLASSLLSGVFGILEDLESIEIHGSALHRVEGRGCADESEMVVADRQQGVRLVLRGVSYQYPGNERPTFTDLSLSVNGGSIVAITGGNGTGKTTLAKIIAGLYSPLRGEVRLSIGQDVIPTVSIPKHVSCMYQEFQRFEASLGENVYWGDASAEPDATKARCLLERSGLNDLSFDLGQTIGRAFGDGRYLSSGQWKRIALARALYKSSVSVYVFDEPCSTIDCQGLNQVLSICRQLANAGAIVIVITHREEVIDAADIELSLDSGVGGARCTEMSNGTVNPSVRRQEATY
jgi:ATP-binding cassette subfamily B protein